MIRGSFFLILFGLLLVPTAPSQVQPASGGILPLDGSAAFHPGDDPVWRSAYIDEQDEWAFVQVPSSWERQGFPNLDGYGWYRIRFRVPDRLREDSLLLVMSAIDDADETYINGVMIGATGSFPPNARSEQHSLRVYPVPRDLLQERNVLAIRVYDMQDSGGVTGSILRIIPVDSLGSALSTLIDASFLVPRQPISNGVMLSHVDPSYATVEECRPHLFREFTTGLFTETILSKASIAALQKGILSPLASWTVDRVYHKDGVLTVEYPNRAVLSIYHPSSAPVRALVFHLSHPTDVGIEAIQPLYTLTKNHWHFRDTSWTTEGRVQRYIVMAWHGCCPEFSERECSAAFAKDSLSGYPVFSLEAEMAWGRRGQTSTSLPGNLNQEETRAISSSLRFLRLATVREPGASEGQVLSGLSPPTSNIARPRDMLTASMAFARCGDTDAAISILRFIQRAQRNHYVLFDILGTERGLGYPYLVTPTWYLGNGDEYRWTRVDDTRFHVLGTPLFLEAMEEIREAFLRQNPGSGIDTSFVRSWWKEVSPLVADHLLFSTEQDSLFQDDGIWPSDRQSAVSTVHAWKALLIASEYAILSDDPARGALYRHRADGIRAKILRLLREAASANNDSLLSKDALLVFHPLMVDAISLGLCAPGTLEAKFLLDMVETGYGIPDFPFHYCSRPDGDWAARQHRPAIALKMAKAWAANGRWDRADSVLSTVTKLAGKAQGMLPELVDPVTRQWYGAIPALGEGNAEYILTILELARHRR